MCFRWCCTERYERVDGRERRQRRVRNFQDEESQRDDDDLRKRTLTSGELEILDRISTNLEADYGRKDWSTSTPQEASDFIVSTLSSLTKGPMQYDAVCSLLISEGKRQRKRGRKEIHEFIRLSAELLTEDQQVELMQILGGLPPAVLGDTRDRDSTRVLLDITSDIRSALTDVRHYHHEGDKVRAAIDTLKPLMKVESLHAEIVVTLMNQLSPHDRFRTVMNQLLLAHLVSPDTDERRTLFAYLFRRLPPEESTSSKA